MEALVFDVNVAMHGYASEAIALQESQSNTGQISSRADAMKALERARAQVFEMEQERKRRA